LEERVLVAGNLLSWGFHGVAFAPDEDPASLWPGVAEALYRIRRAEKLGGQTDFSMVKDLTPAENHVEALRRFSYRPMETEPNMVLQIDPEWRSYEDYLAALDAKYRRNSRDQLKKLTVAGCQMERVADLRPLAKRLHDLYLSVQSRAAVKLITLPSGFLPALAEAAGNDFRCTVVRRGEQVLGFVTTLRDGDTAIAYYIGFDRAEAVEGLPLYLRLLHVTVADAIDWRCRRLSLGRTALEPKATLGAKPEPMAVWMRHRVPALNWVLRGMFDSVPHAEAPERNPFKVKEAR
jgi:Acetyltransferase (GNAT) domain